MADWPILGSCSKFVGINHDLAISKMVAACGLTDITENVKTAWGEAIASLPQDINGLWLTIYRPHTTVSSTCLCDIGIGAEGSEIVLIENILYNLNQAAVGYAYFFPISVKAGSRIAIRMQQSNTSPRICYFSVSGVAGGDFLYRSFGKVVTYGANTADSGGVSVDPGGTANTKGSYSEIVASTSHNISYLIVAIGNQDTLNLDANVLLDLAVGASGSEVNFAENIYFGMFTNELFMPSVFSFPINIPAGTRISARAQSNVIATGRTFDLILYGIH